MAFNTADLVESSTKHHLKILVVDDDDLNRRMMRLLLVRDGHDVQVVANGAEALDAVKYQRFDVVFMDLQMPIMDGFEASRQIREWENGNLHTYIVALTASYLPEEGYLLFEAGIDNYIAKPFEVDHVRRLLGVIARAEHYIPEPPHTSDEREPAPDPILDVGKGLQQVGGDDKNYRELLLDFIQGLPDRISTLEKFLEEQDLDSLARSAHNLKGVSSNLGALELSECAAKLDKQFVAGYTDKDQSLILDLKKAEENLRRTATDFLNNKENIVASA
jgi:CheY-like chemotaxis protein/HPt (histidine-containing phosphotransfer) domain-containing protein